VGDEPDHRALIADLRARLAEAWGREQGERVRLVSQERDAEKARADAALDAALRDLPRPSQAPLEALVRAVFTAGWAASHQHDADQWIAGGLEGPFEEQPCCREALAGHLADIPALLRKVAP